MRVKHSENCACCQMGFEEFKEQLQQTIDRYGHAIIHMVGQFGDREVKYSHTVGLAEVGVSELIVFGLPDAVAGSVLNAAAVQARSGNLPTDLPIEQLVSMPVVAKNVDASRVSEFVRVANARAGRLLNVLQVVWPDQNGVFPWDAKFDEALRPAQPLLSGLH